MPGPDASSSTRPVGDPLLLGRRAVWQSPSRWAMGVLVAIGGGFWWGLVLAWRGALVDGDWQLDGWPVAGRVLAWLVLAVLTLLLTVGTLAGLLVVLVPEGVVVTEAEVGRGRRGRRGRAGRLRERLPVASMRRVLVLPGRSSTWQDAADPRPRGGRSRLHTELWVQGGDTTYRVTEDRHWPRVLAHAAAWVAERPELVQDDVTRRVLDAVRATPAGASDSERPGPVPARSPLRGWWVAALLLLAVVVVVTTAAGEPPSAADLVGMAGSSALFGIVLAVAVATVRDVGSAAVQAVRRRDAGAPFRADELGRYSDLVSGRMSSLRISGREPGTLGLAARWVVLTALFLGSLAAAALVLLAPVLLVYLLLASS